jgi:hypothetical protein
VATTRKRDIRQALIDEPLTRPLTVDVQQDPIRRHPLTAVAGHSVPMIEVAVRAWTVCRRIDGELDGLPVSVRTRICRSAIAVIVPISRFAIFAVRNGAVNCTRSPTANVRSMSR